MAISKGTLRVCRNGHSYYKSSSCPVCPTCEAQKNQGNEFGKLSAPAKRALENAGIKSLAELSNYSESELLNLHGIGPTSIPKLKLALKDHRLSLKQKN